MDENLIAQPNPTRAVELHDTINRHTLGQLINRLNGTTQTLDAQEAVLSNALKERNRLFHSFYRQHNFRRNSDDGRALMLTDLEAIHCALLGAYKAVMLLSGVDIEALSLVAQTRLPNQHLPI